MAHSDRVAVQPTPALLAPGSLVQQIELFILLWLAADILLSPVWIAGDDFVSVFHVALYVHIGTSLYAGVVGIVRSVTWILLIVSLVVAQMGAFLGFVLPWGQTSFWLANRFADLPVIGSALAVLIPDHAGVSEAALALLGLVLLSLDLVAMHYPFWRRRPIWRFAVFVAAAVAISVVLRLALGWLIPAPPDAVSSYPTPPNVVPAWYEWPYYCLLHEMPDKLGGVILLFAALLVPAIWPWARAEILRTGRLRWLWRACCVAGACVYVGLAYLGTVRPEGAWLAIARVLTILYFGFYLLPFTLRMVHPRRAA